MPVFFFDLETADKFERDQVGVQFDSVEAAFLGAHEAAVAMIVELLRDRRDASRHRFEVRNEHGLVVLELPFLEVLHPRSAAKPPMNMDAPRRLRDTLARSRVLREELQEALERARRVAQSNVALFAPASGEPEPGAGGGPC